MSAAPATSTCSSCGAVAVASSAFCPRCGRPMSSDRRQAPWWLVPSPRGPDTTHGVRTTFTDAARLGFGFGIGLAIASLTIATVGLAILLIVNALTHVAR